MKLFLIIIGIIAALLAIVAWQLQAPFWAFLVAMIVIILALAAQLFRIGEGP